MFTRRPDARLLTLALFLAGTTACSEGGDSPTGPVTGPETPPAAPTSFRVNVQAQYITISPSEACDGRSLFSQTPLDGEFHWRVQAGIGSSVAVEQSSGFGSVTGTPYGRGPKGTIDFADTDWNFSNLGPGDRIVVQLRGIEWDGLSRDSDLNDVSGDFIIDADRPLSNRAQIRIGGDNCGMTLTFNYTVAAQ